VFPNITIAMRFFVSLLALKAPGECTFNALKQAKNYYRSTTGQGPLIGFATLNINFDLAQELDFPSIIHALSEKIIR
jgi:hypothetical protein